MCLCVWASGAEPGQWFFDLKDGTGCVGEASASDPQSFDCRFEVTSENFVRMFQGDLIPSKAFMSGDMSIEGDVFAAIKLEKLLRKLNQ